MGIFDTLKNAILGSKLRPGPGPAGAAQVGAATAASPANRQTPNASPAQTSPAAAPASQVEIEGVLSQLAAQKQEKLNWQSSIVDLMKVVDLDPSLENRKTLARELGYTGNEQDSASMNIWLHKAVMQKLAASGGKVPDSLRH